MRKVNKGNHNIVHKSSISFSVFGFNYKRYPKPYTILYNIATTETILHFSVQ